MKQTRGCGCSWQSRGFSAGDISCVIKTTGLNRLTHSGVSRKRATSIAELKLNL